MKKLEKLTGKSLSNVNLKRTIGGYLAPDYTILSTGCTETGQPNHHDCSDSKRDK